MKKENILSVLIDESGDFGKLDYNDPYYYVLMVLHEQNNTSLGKSAEELEPSAPGAEVINGDILNGDKLDDELKTFAEKYI